MSAPKKINWTKKLAKNLNAITLKNNDELFLWKSITIFLLVLMAFFIGYFVQLGYNKTNALLDQTTEMVIKKSGFDIESIDIKAFEEAAVIIDYKKNPLTLPSKIRNLFFYDLEENTNYKPTSIINTSSLSLETNFSN